MNKSVKNMFSVLMDAIADAGYIADYSVMARDDGDIEWAEWFKNHAMKRLDMLREIYEDVRMELNLDRRIRDEDEIAYALDCYIHGQIEALEKRMMNL